MSWILAIPVPLLWLVSKVEACSANRPGPPTGPVLERQL
jgi:hypothetical protein